MHIKFLALITIVALSAGCASMGADHAVAPNTIENAAPDSSSYRAQVMVLGAYHFTGGGSDEIQIAVDDHLAPHRQAQIETVIDHLAVFAPTKIIVEMRNEYDDEFNALYASYRAGEHELTVNERQQIGMRLAARLGHERLYSIDYENDMDFEAMTAAATAADQSYLLDHLEAVRRQYAALGPTTYDNPDVTVLERLRVTNLPVQIEAHSLYLSLAQIGGPDDQIGARQMSDWWARNMRTFAGVAQVSEPGDRILIIYGAGHKYLLDQFFDDSIEFQSVDVLPYLDD